MTNNLKSIDNIDKQDLLEVDVLSMGHFNASPRSFSLYQFCGQQGQNLCIILKDDDDFDNEEKPIFFLLLIALMRLEIYLISSISLLEAITVLKNA